MNYHIFHGIVLAALCVEFWIVAFFGLADRTYNGPSSATYSAVNVGIAVATGCLLPGLIVALYLKYGKYILTLAFAAVAHLVFGGVLYFSTQEQIPREIETSKLAVMQTLTDTRLNARLGTRPSANENRTAPPTTEDKSDLAQTLASGDAVDQKVLRMLAASQRVHLLLYPDAQERESVERDLAVNLRRTFQTRVAVHAQLEFCKTIAYWLLSIGGVLSLITAGICVLGRKQRLRQPLTEAAL